MLISFGDGLALQKKIIDNQKSKYRKHIQGFPFPFSGRE